MTLGSSLPRAQRPVVGVTMDPFRDELYTAHEGGGAFMNGVPIHVDTEAAELSQAVVGSNLGYLGGQAA